MDPISAWEIAAAALFSCADASSCEGGWDASSALSAFATARAMSSRGDAVTRDRMGQMDGSAQNGTLVKGKVMRVAQKHGGAQHGTFRVFLEKDLRNFSCLSLRPHAQVSLNKVTNPSPFGSGQVNKRGYSSCSCGRHMGGLHEFHWGSVRVFHFQKWVFIAQATAVANSVIHQAAFLG